MFLKEGTVDGEKWKYVIFSFSLRENNMIIGDTAHCNDKCDTFGSELPIGIVHNLCKRKGGNKKHLFIRYASCKNTAGKAAGAGTYNIVWGKNGQNRKPRDIMKFGLPKNCGNIFIASADRTIKKQKCSKRVSRANDEYPWFVQIRLREGWL